jgi:hypothetical protein
LWPLPLRPKATIVSSFRLEKQESVENKMNPRKKKSVFKTGIHVKTSFPCPKIGIRMKKESCSFFVFFILVVKKRFFLTPPLYFEYASLKYLADTA